MVYLLVAVLVTVSDSSNSISVLAVIIMSLLLRSNRLHSSWCYFRHWTPTGVASIRYSVNSKSGNCNDTSRNAVEIHCCFCLFQGHSKRVDRVDNVQGPRGSREPQTKMNPKINHWFGGPSLFLVHGPPRILLFLWIVCWCWCCCCWIGFYYFLFVSLVWVFMLLSFEF